MYSIYLLEGCYVIYVYMFLWKCEIYGGSAP